MPQVTVYVRAEDLESWKAIEKKSEWLHLQLAGAGTSRPTLSNEKVLSDGSTAIIIPFMKKAQRAMPPTPVEQSILESLPVTTADKLDLKTCQHGANPRFCRYAKNGKPCK